jgi:two-component system, cell cycle response regulator CtrA
MRVLIVGDKLQRFGVAPDPPAARGFTYDTATSGAEALEFLAVYDYIAVLMEMDLPDMQAERLIQGIRRRERLLAVLVVATGGTSHRRAQILDQGADDVIASSVDAEELVARLRAIVRRQTGHVRSTLKVGTIELDQHARQLLVGGKIVPLTPKQYELLELLVLRRGTAVRKEALLSNLYGGLDPPELKVIDVLVCRLRKKLGIMGLRDIIETVRGTGYMLRAAPAVNRQPASETSRVAVT